MQNHGNNICAMPIFFFVSCVLALALVLLSGVLIFFYNVTSKKSFFCGSPFVAIRHFLLNEYLICIKPVLL